MRLVSWNCCSDGARKWAWIEQLDADVAVICEGPRRSPRPSATLFEPAVAWHSVGHRDHKQLAIGSSRRGLEALEARDGQGQWAIAGRVAGGPDVLGVWSRPAKRAGASYAASVAATLEAWEDVLAQGHMVVAGDFNVGFPVGRDGRAGYARCLARAWERLGLVSVYHAFFDARLGDESRATFFDERRRQLGRHIDYVLVHRDQLQRVRNVEVGDFHDWVGTGRSDHVPIVVDFDW